SRYREITASSDPRWSRHGCRCFRRRGHLRRHLVALSPVQAEAGPAGVTDPAGLSLVRAPAARQAAPKLPPANGHPALGSRIWMDGGPALTIASIDTGSSSDAPSLVHGRLASLSPAFPRFRIAPGQLRERLARRCGGPFVARRQSGSVSSPMLRTFRKSKRPYKF